MADSLTLYDVAPGKTVGGRYTVVRPHRQGGFSTAFEVRDEEDGGRRELQLFPSGLFEASSQARDFRQRLMPWTEVRSDAVLAVRDILVLGDDALAFVTDFPEGETLRERLKREERLSSEEVLAMGRRLLRGLERVHGRLLVHGDVKPTTVHLTGEGAEVRPLLVDGGVTPSLWTAKHLGDKTTLIGTPYYAPVEQFGGDAPDVRSDVYNVATVLFESLTGVLPWAGKTFLEVFQAKLQDPPAMSARAPGLAVDPKLEEAIRRGCLADRRRRYGSAEEFHQALSALA